MRAPLLLLAFLLCSPAPASADHASHRYRVSGRPELRLVSGDGHVQIRPGRTGVIEIEVETEGWRIGPGEVRILESQSGDRVSFEVREPHRWRFGWTTAARRRISISALVPPELDLNVVTGDGSVQVNDLRGGLQFRTGDGRVEASNLTGELDFETGDGNIEAMGLQGDLSGRTGDGHVHIEGRFQSLRVQSGDGPVVVAVDPGSKVADEWSLTTGDGSLLLRLPDDLHADLEASTGDGHISSDLPIMMKGSLNRRSIHGRLNGGGAPISLRTGDGPIRIEGRTR